MYKGQYSDVEAGPAVALYPDISYSENIDRWNFIRKIYGILSVQLLLTVAVAGLVIYNPSVALFFNSSSGFGLYILLVISPFIWICALYYFHRTHPINYILLFAFTACISLAVGLSCSFTDGKVIFEAAILTAAVVISLTLYTFWAARRGYDFNFLGPILFSTLVVLIVFGFIQVLFPLGRTSVMIYGVLASIIFSGYIVFDTDNIIKRYNYDEYIWATVALYLDIINLFLSLLTLFRATRD
ncbi:hypothetical protein SUGI_0234060 [Cryptomeria japonica]|uniref:protein LIFEGUARD 2 n=1 Tax=Cryptomeria japonica TaxID=3369 RepID=UPI002408C1A1|nr:protein LIFEGUARD 2 [Cryptomeria japonica]GLJ14475.1 hypothetical protein SUGI_0234060 [Cryptomeria japonica]